MARTVFAPMPVVIGCSWRSGCYGPGLSTTRTFMVSPHPRQIFPVWLSRSAAQLRAAVPQTKFLGPRCSNAKILRRAVDVARVRRNVVAGEVRPSHVLVEGSAGVPPEHVLDNQVAVRTTGA